MHKHTKKLFNAVYWCLNDKRVLSEKSINLQFIQFTLNKSKQQNNLNNQINERK